jgi:signal transduction histidine kinase
MAVVAMTERALTPAWHRRGLARPRGITTRSALAAVSVVAVVLLAAAPLAVWFLHRSLLQEAEQAARLRAEQLANELSTGGPTAVAGLLRTSRGERSLAQVIAPGGAVVASSADLVGLPPMTDAVPAPGSRATTIEKAPDPEDTAEFLVVSRGVRVDGARYRVLVGNSLASVDRATRTVESALVVALPAVMLLVGAATYVFVGRSLRPVEAIRARAEQISSLALTERFPEPTVRDEVGRLSLTMNDMLERLQEAQGAQHRFVADASHELRSPLATLRSTLEIALVHPRTRTTDNAQAMLAETERLQRLVDDLVLLANTDERPRAARDHVDLDDLVLDEMTRLRATTALTVDGSVEPTRVRGNRHELAQVVRNLVDNAGQHAQTRITLKVASEQTSAGPAAVFSVGDDGPGIDPADRTRVFGRFVRLDHARARHEGGSGLGLAIVEQIVRQHGGTVTVGVSEHGGALFVVRLPNDPE